MNAQDFYFENQIFYNFSALDMPKIVIILHGPGFSIKVKHEKMHWQLYYLEQVAEFCALAIYK